MSDTHADLRRLEAHAEAVIRDAEQASVSAERLLEVVHVAHRLRVSRQFVRELCRGGKLIAVRVGRRWRIRPSELERYLKAHSIAA